MTNTSETRIPSRTRWPPRSRRTTARRWLARFDPATARALENATDAILSGKPAGPDHRPHSVSFLASAGMATLVAAHQRAGSTTAIVVVADGPATSRTLKMTSLDQAFALHSTLEAALAAFRQR
ncbi:STAS domain-containing protein [Nocardia abscessus]|uniref:STAS domain-containing protein n=1 Tax=Nocardia abscessus TaxID=120957 RepID=UPI00245881D7|nr:STAS domain-containing protein [Nocardia abscessus]